MRKSRIYLLFALLLYSCANQVPLEGGPKDTVAPVLEKAVPDTFALNVKGRKIVLTFDEFVVLKDATKEVIVSPPIDEQPVVQVTGKSVEVIFQDSLKSNTTYTIQFGAAIADNNEGNILRNYAYTFSTGNFLDSLSTQVILLDAFTLKPIPDAKWMLYNAMNDCTPYKERPFYVGYSNDGGNAAIKYMRAGTFYQFALTETNNDFLYNAADEWVGFSDSIITPGDSAVHRLLMFREKSTKNKMQTAKPVERGRIYFKFAGDASGVVIRPLTDSLPPLKGHTEYGSEAKDSLIYWHPPIKKDTLFFEVSFPGRDTDTVRIIYRENKKSKQKGQQPVSEKMEIKTNLAAKFDYYKPIELEFNRPVPDFDSSCVQLFQNNKPLPYRWEFTDSVQRKISIIYPFRQGTDYVFKMRDSCFADLRGAMNDSLIVPFKTTQQKEYTTLTLKATGLNPTQLIFQLLDKEDKILQEKIVQKDSVYKGLFTNLLPGSYRVKIIYDDNANGKWDTGNYALRRQPEKVSFFPQNIDMKPGFDLDFDWDVNAPPPDKKDLLKEKKK